MEQKPKKRKRYAFPYFFLGLFIAVIVVGILSVLFLIYQKQAITFDNMIQLQTSSLLFWYIDIIAIYSALVWGLVGYEKERAEDSKYYAESVTHNQQKELLNVKENQSQSDIRHQEEVALLNEQLAKQGTTYQDLETIIRRGKQQWQATFDALSDLIVLADETGSILRCNRATGEIFQLGFNQIIGRRIDELFPSDSVNLLDMTPGEKKDMKVPHLDLWYEVSKNHLLVDGRQEGWVYIFRNITLQKQAFRDQQRLTQYYELLVNNSPVAILTLDMEDRIVDCNPAFENLFLFDKKEAIGSKAEQLITPPELIFEARGMVEILRNGGKVKSITQRLRKDGSLVDVEVFGIPVVLGGKQVGSLGLFHDVSDLVRAQLVASAPVEQAIEEAIEVVEEEQPLPEPAAEEEVLFAEPEPALDVDDLSEATPAPRRLISIEKIEGIGPVYGQKLLEVGIKYTDDLLVQGKNRKGRADLVEKTGISSTLILKWVNMADMMRIRGIGEEYSELLEKAGVDTVKELRNRVPEHLHQALAEANEAHKLVRRLPHLSEVENWVQGAKEAETIVTY